MASLSHSSSSDPQLLLALLEKSTRTLLEAYAATGLTSPNLDATARPPSEVFLTPEVRDATRVLQGASAQLCATLVHPSLHMIDMAYKAVDSALLNVVTECKIADHLVEGPQSVEYLALQAGVDPIKLGKVMRNLANKHVFRAVSKDVYVNNRLSVTLLQDDLVSSLVGKIAEEETKSVVQLADTMLDPDTAMSTAGEKTAFARAFGKSFFQMLGEDAKRGPRFGRAMQSWTAFNGGTDALADFYPWASVPKGSTLCDVGAGPGHVALALVKKHPHLKAVVQDLPKVTSEAEAVWTQALPAALKDGKVQFVSFDFFTDPPVAGCQFYYLKHIMHDWSEDQCVTILRNIRTAIGTGDGRVLIHEFVLADAGKESGIPQAPAPLLPEYGYGTSRKYNLDVCMTALLNSRERTLDEYIELGEQAGFRFAKTYFDGEMTVVELQVAS